MALGLKNRHQDYICCNCIWNRTQNTTSSMKYNVEKPCLLNHHLSLSSPWLTMYALPTNIMPRFCSAKQYNLFLFEQLSNMLNRHCHGDVLNQRFVISPRTGVLHACLSPEQQNQTTLASEEKAKDYNSGLIIRETKLKVELHRAKISVLFSTDTHLQRYLNQLSATTSRRSFLFFSQQGVARVEICSHDVTSWSVNDHRK